MHTIWGNLFWKEWCEHRGKLAALTAIALGAPILMWATMLQSRNAPIDPFFVVWITLMLYVPLASAFVGMGLAASEQASGTIHLLRGLPSPTWRAAVAKLVVGVAIVVAPILLLEAGAATTEMIGESISDGFWQYSAGQDTLHLALPITSGFLQLDIALLGLLCAVSLTIWVAAIGVNLSNEIRAGAVALVTIVAIWGMFLAACSQVEAFRTVRGVPAAVQILAAGMPGGFVLVEPLNDGSLRWVGVGLVFLITHGLLVWRWLAVYGMQSSPRVVSPKQRAAQPTQRDWLGPPFRSARGAIVWQTLRTCAAVVGAALVLAVAWSAFMMSVDPNLAPDTRRGIELALFVTIACGFLAALIAGVGVLLEDLRPGLNRFWRSRPISASAWFWTKYAGGLLTLAIPFGLAAVSILFVTREVITPSNSAIGAGLFALLYTSAVAATAIVRQPLYSAILGVSLFGFLAAPWLDDWLPIGIRIAGLIIATVAAAIAGWLAMKNDWSLAGR